MLWLHNAAHANAMAARLAKGLATLPGVSLLVPDDANEVFVRLPELMSDGLQARGFRFLRWDHALGPGAVWLVTAFSTREADVDAFVATARGTR